MKKYYIYHIPTFVHKDGMIGKIGCTAQKVINRIKKQGYTDYKILEEHECIYKASDREIELQKEYGYKVDTIPYWKVYLQRIKNQPTTEQRRKGAIKSGKISVESGHLDRIRTKQGSSKGGKKGGKNHVESGHLASIRTKENQSKGGITTSSIKRTCPHCGKQGKGNSMLRWHFDKCKHKPNL